MVEVLSQWSTSCVVEIGDLQDRTNLSAPSTVMILNVYVYSYDQKYFRLIAGEIMSACLCLDEGAYW